VRDRIRADVAAYYSARLVRYGAIPMGVDWSCQATQQLRFVQLLKICAFDAPFSLNDLGCGYGALAAFLAERHQSAKVDYLGIDLSRALVQRARRRHRGDRYKRFMVGSSCPRPADYTVASGIMNVTLGHPVADWEGLVRDTIRNMHCMSRRGFAINFLAAPTLGLPPAELYCPLPDTWRRFCEDELSCEVEVLSNYGLREFTLVVRRAGEFPTDGVLPGDAGSPRMAAPRQ
jgi:SAM-dependent methyltransferase